MDHWLVKSEPEDWSFDDHLAAGTTAWTGVRNAQAQNFLRAMKPRDRVLFYHSGKERAIVGLCEVTREAYPDPEAGSDKLITVDLKALRPAKSPVTLATIKDDPSLTGLHLVRQSRLSVMPIDAASWKTLTRLAGLA